MPKTEAQKRAQKNFMDRGTWKKLAVIMKTEDIDHIKEIAGKRDMPYGTWIKEAISGYSGEHFSWDDLPMNPPKSDKQDA